MVSDALLTLVGKIVKSRLALRPGIRVLARRHLAFLPWSLKRPESGWERVPASNVDAYDGKVYGSSAERFAAIVEIERFALLRQRVGYSLADKLILTLTSRLRAQLPCCLVGRVSQTSIEFEFSAGSAQEASMALRRLTEVMEQPVELCGQPFYLLVTIGATSAGSGAVGPEVLDRAASGLAVARATRAKSVVAGVDIGRDDGIDYVSLMGELRAALENGEISLHYQPKLSVRTNSFKSCEALLRWHHPIYGLLRTDKLIEFAEVTGAIRDITYWTIERALIDQSTLTAHGHKLAFFVNISGVMLPDPAFAQRVLALLARPRGDIGFEITETAVIDDPKDAITNLQAFADAGVKIAIDDYGSGLSSLVYLKQLPANELKIDRMFVCGLTESHRDPLIVRSTIDLAHALEMEVAAEGVEDQMSLALLRVMGCDLIQGHVVSKPLPLPALERFLAAHETGGENETESFDMENWRLRSVA